jgi:hypothetical protein
MMRGFPCFRVLAIVLGQDALVGGAGLELLLRRPLAHVAGWRQPCDGGLHSHFHEHCVHCERRRGRLCCGCALLFSQSAFRWIKLECRSVQELAAQSWWWPCTKSPDVLGLLVAGMLGLLSRLLEAPPPAATACISVNCCWWQSWRCSAVL